MRVEVFDGTGNRYAITFEGNVTRDKALRLLDLIELLGGMPGVEHEWSQTTSELSKLDRVQFVVEKHFPLVWFSSKDVLYAYEHEFKQPISLSTVSTYLSRMADRRILASNNASNKKRYRLIMPMTQDAINLTKDSK